MATINWVNEGENFIANVLFGATAVPATIYLGLYKSPISAPGESATLVDLTEPSGNGYGRKSLLRGSWSIDGDLATYAEQAFVASGGDWGYIYGYFLATSSDSSGKLLTVVHFDTALEVVDGKGMKITPKVRVA